MSSPLASTFSAAVTTAVTACTSALSCFQLTFYGAEPRYVRRWGHSTHDPAAAAWPADPPPARVTAADLAVLRTHDPTHPTGYEGVYRRVEPDRQAVRYVGKVFKKPAGPVRQCERQAAEDVAWWWRSRFGDRWPGFWAARKSRGYAVFRSDGGWRVMAWVGGRMEYVGQGGRTPRGTLYPTRAAAAAGFRAWVRAGFGLFAGAAHHVLRRPGVPRPRSR